MLNLLIVTTSEVQSFFHDSSSDCCSEVLLCYVFKCYVNENDWSLNEYSLLLLQIQTNKRSDPNEIEKEHESYCKF